MPFIWLSSASTKSELLAAEAVGAVRLIARELWVPLPAVASPPAAASRAPSSSTSVLTAVLAALDREEGVPLRWAITAVDGAEGEGGVRHARLEVVLLVEP